MRHLYKSWQDKRPGWTRRVRWYKPELETEKIRLKFEDETGVKHEHFTNVEDAQKAFEAFKTSKRTLYQ